MEDKLINHLSAPQIEHGHAAMGSGHVSHFDFITLDMAPIVRKVAHMSTNESYVKAANKKYI